MRTIAITGALALVTACSAVHDDSKKATATEAAPLAAAVPAKTAAQVKRRPAPIDAATLGAMRTRRTTKTPPLAKKSRGHGGGAVPTWDGSFTYQGTTYPYTMVGSDPKKGGTTRIKTALLPISLFFDEFVDAAGNPLVLDLTPTIPQVLDSPNFERSRYATGHTQFADAVQRASFYDDMRPDWHTMLERPRMLKPVTVEVPPGAATLFTGANGQYIGLVDAFFFFSQLTTILELEDIRSDELTIAVSPNINLTISDDSGQFFIGGFHSPNYTLDGQIDGLFIWTSWLDGAIAPWAPDAIALSHEVSETFGDPMGTNPVPIWQFPGGVQACQDNLEVGDPAEVFENAAFPVTIHGFTYHPQTEVLLSWFTRDVPSRGFQGAYSFPDTSLVTAPSQPCPTADGGP